MSLLESGEQRHIKAVNNKYIRSEASSTVKEEEEEERKKKKKEKKKEEEKAKQSVGVEFRT